jgi:AmmeMemoRadiSam system protein B
MRRVLIVLLSIFSVMEIYSQNKSTDRQPVAAGSFYEADKEALTRDIAGLFTECKKSQATWKIRAIISPHAGYIFSGRIAASALSITPKNAAISNIFLIGSSHVMAFDGAL